MKILVLAVNYNSNEKAKAYLTSWDKAAQVACIDTEVTVVVADNSEKYETMQGDWPSLCWMQVPTHANRGYLGAVSYVIQEKKFDLNVFDYCVICNVDLEVSQDFLTILEKKQYENTIGCIAPMIYSLGEHRNRNPKILSRPSAKKMRSFQLMYEFPVIYQLNKVKNHFRNKREHVYKEQLQIYAPHGSFMIFTRPVASFLQSFQYPAFLFGEEIYFAENIRQMGLHVIYEPELKVTDHDHESTGKTRKRTFYNWNAQAMKFLTGEYFKNESDREKNL